MTAAVAAHWRKAMLLYPCVEIVKGSCLRFAALAMSHPGQPRPQIKRRNSHATRFPFYYFLLILISTPPLGSDKSLSLSPLRRVFWTFPRPPFHHLVVVVLDFLLTTAWIFSPFACYCHLTTTTETTTHHHEALDSFLTTRFDRLSFRRCPC